MVSWRLDHESHVSVAGVGFGVAAEIGGIDPIVAVIIHDGGPMIRLTSIHARHLTGDFTQVALEADVRCAG